jgi:hypothetical protein
MNYTFVLFILASLTILTGCQQDQVEDALPLVNGIFLSKAEQEIVIPTQDTIITKTYEQYFNWREDVQIPLFKSIKHPDYWLFVGLPVGADLQRLSAKLPTEQVIQKNKEQERYYQLRLKKDYYLIEYAQNFESAQSLIYLALLTTDSLVAHQQTADRFQNRLIFLK